MEAVKYRLQYLSDHFPPEGGDFVDGHFHDRAHFQDSPTHSNTRPTINSEWSATQPPCIYVFKLFSNLVNIKYSPNRSTKMLSASLAKDYSRPMGLASNPGLSVGTFINPNATLPGHTPQIDTSRTECSGSGSPGTIRQAGCSSDLNRRYPGFVSSLFVVPKKDGGNRPVVTNFLSTNTSRWRVFTC